MDLPMDPPGRWPYSQKRMADASLRCAAIQLQSDDRVDQNLERCSRLVARAAAAGAQLVLLPENFAFFGSEAVKPGVAEDLQRGGRITDALRTWARKHAVHLIAGGYPEKSADASRPYNTSAVFDPAGELVASYRKLHLFDVELSDGRQFCESEGTSAGDEVVVVTILGYQVGLTICYDLRFPALFAALAARGVEVLTVPAAFTSQTGAAHWHVLLRARAIEWQCWLLAAGQWGKHPGARRTYGHSLIVDPWGTVVAQASQRDAVVLADLDKQQLQEIRQRIPCAQHRRPLP